MDRCQHGFDVQFIQPAHGLHHVGGPCTPGGIARRVADAEQGEGRRADGAGQVSEAGIVADKKCRLGQHGGGGAQGSAAAEIYTGKFGGGGDDTGVDRVRLATQQHQAVELRSQPVDQRQVTPGRPYLR